MGTNRVEVTATAMAAGGDAIAREPEGRVVFVEGALPGERVVVELVQQRKDFAKGRVVEVLDASPDRVVPPCAAVERGCGGCQWQHVGPAAQAGLRRDIVADALRRIARMPDPPLAADVRAAQPTRTTLRLGVDPATGQAGLRTRHGHDLVDIGAYLVAHPLLHDLIAHGRFPGAGEVTLRVSAATGERLAWAVGREGDDAGVRVEVPDDVLVGPDAAVNEDVAGRRWRVSARSFFQPGPEAAALLVDAVRQAAGPMASGAVVLDAYAGVGLLGGSLAPERLVAVESAPSSVADAVVNLADLDASVVEGEVADAVPRLPAVRPDLAVADPSRPGLGRSAAAALAGTGADRLVLVSCDPASMARDVTLLDDLGYRLDSSQVLDLFPHTFHVEVVSAFQRG